MKLKHHDEIIKLLNLIISEVNNHTNDELDNISSLAQLAIDLIEIEQIGEPS